MGIDLQLYRFMFDNSSCGVFFQDAEGTIVDVNPTALKIFGLSRNEFLAGTFHQPGWRLIAENGSPVLPGEYPSAVALLGGRPVTDCVVGIAGPRHPDYIWLRINAHPLFRPDEEIPYRVFVSFVDISAEKRSLESLRRSEERFRMIMALSPDIISLVGSDGSLVYNSPAALTIHGYSEEEMRARNTFELMHPDDRERTEEAFRQLLSSPTATETIRYRYRNRDGSYQLMECRAGNHLDNPLVNGIIAISRDITEAEEALREKDERYRAVVNSQTEFVDRVFPDGTLTFVNDALCRYTGSTREELIGRSMFDFVHGEEQEQLRRCLQALTPEQPTNETCNRCVLPDNTIRWHHWTNTAIFNSDGTVSEYQCVGRDITTQKEAELARNDYQEKLEIALEAAHAGIWSRDLVTGELYWSEEVYPLFGISRDITVSDIDQWSKLIHPDDRKIVETAIAEAIRTRTDYSTDYRIIMPDGTNRWLTSLGRTSYSDRGEPLRLAGITMDITVRKETEIALQEARSRLEDRVAERTASLAAANEKIKQISFQLLQSEEQERVRIAAELHDQVGQSLLLAKLKLDMLASDAATDADRDNAAAVSKLLDDSIQEIRTLTFGLRPPLLDAVGLEAALQWLCPQLANDYGLLVEFRQYGRIAPIAAEYRFPIYQAVRELLLNVSKHAGVNRAELTLQSQPGLLFITVADRGCGFVPGSPHNEHGGTGSVGLFNVQRRIEQLGGECEIATGSTGTVVTLTIPVQDPEGGCR